MEKTIQRLMQNIWFPRIRKYVKDYIAACMECCYNIGKCGKPEGEMYINEGSPVPFQKIHINHLGPFVRRKKGYVHKLAISDEFTKFLIMNRSIWIFCSAGACYLRPRNGLYLKAVRIFFLTDMISIMLRQL